MANQVSLQTDLANIPGAAIDLLGAITPILRALSTDSVNPLAVLQIEAIGRCFPISGPLARQMPDILTRSGSVKLTRLQTLVGWMPGDTTTALAQTAGGQAAALLTLGLVEMFCRNSTGHLLFELSMKVLPADRSLASMAQLSDLAETISNKLQPLAFGHHHAIQVTRIRETYLNSGIEVPPSISASLLDRLTVEAMVELLDSVQQALRDDTLMVYIEGFQGLGGVVALLTALCPNDVLLLVENGVIFQGQRRSIVISVMHKQATLFQVEKILRGGAKTSTALPVSFRENEFLTQPGKLSSYDHLSMKTEGCLAKMVEQLFVTVTFQSAAPVITCFVDLIGAIMCSFTGIDFGSALPGFPLDGLRSLLGLPVLENVRDKLGLLFGVAPALQNLDPVLHYEIFRQSVASLAPDSTCLCSQCPGSHIWATLSSKRSPCPLRSIWGALQDLVGHAVLLCLVDTDLETLAITQYPRTKLGLHLCRRLLLRTARDVECALEDAEAYSVRDLQTDLCQLLGTIPSNAGDGQNVLGTSSGATSILPSTLEMRPSGKAHAVRYRLLDGQFHDGRNYYKALIERAHIPPRPLAEESILPPQHMIGPSQVGVHSDMTLSLRPYHNSLALRAMVTFSAKFVNVSFYDAHLAYMATSVAPPCDHYPNEPVALPDTDCVIATSVEAPVASNGRISVALTHGDSEAQLLAGVQGIPSLFQGSSCLDCMIRDAKDKGFRLLIQS